MPSPALSLVEIEAMSSHIYQSKFFSQANNVSQIVTLMLIAVAEGDHPASIISDFDIFGGKFARKTHSCLARFQRVGGVVEWHCLSDDKAEATFTHPSGGSVRIDWTMERAKNAGLAGKDNYKKFARAMLRSRTIGEGVRAVYPAALGGLRLDMEMMNFDGDLIDDLDDAPAPSKEIKMPTAKPAAAKVEPAAKVDPATDKTVVTDVEPKPAAAAEPASLPVEKAPATDDPLASEGAKKFIAKKLDGKDITPHDFAKQHSLDWDALTVSGFNTLKKAL